ncbi:S8 family peptidase [Desulforhopalus sp. 52FAK]
MARSHPDSGYIDHRELAQDEGRVLNERQLDLVDNDNDAAYSKATHGLATASVILGNETGLIKGIAPKASLIPIRIAKVKKLVPAPVLLGRGMRCLRKAIEHAENESANIVSISLGGTKSISQSKALEKAINRAEKAGSIILAAAGNRVRFVVYPAKYKNVIAVAASNYSNSEWSGSCRGKEVDITAPGENVWKADINTPNKVKRSSGTSYAVANIAGVAALWLAHWGKQNLVEIFGGKANLSDGFVRMLKHSANTHHKLPNDGFGAGIVHAKSLLDLDPKDFS